MYPFTLSIVVALLVLSPAPPIPQAGSTRTLVAAPALARYAHEGVQVYLLIATDGGQGTGMAAARGETVQAGQDLVRARTEEARCAADALALKPPILLSFPD